MKLREEVDLILPGDTVEVEKENSEGIVVGEGSLIPRDSIEILEEILGTIEIGSKSTTEIPSHSGRTLDLQGDLMTTSPASSTTAGEIRQGDRLAAMTDRGIPAEEAMRTEEVEISERVDLLVPEMTETPDLEEAATAMTIEEATEVTMAEEVISEAEVEEETEAEEDAEASVEVEADSTQKTRSQTAIPLTKKRPRPQLKLSHPSMTPHTKHLNLAASNKEATLLVLSHSHIHTHPLTILMLRNHN